MKPGIATFLSTVVVVTAVIAGGASAATTIFLDDFSGPEGESLDGRRPPGGGGTWTVELGSATLNGGRARIECPFLDPQFSDPAGLCFGPGRVLLSLDASVAATHVLQITAIDLQPAEENLDITGISPAGFGAWRISFDRVVGIIAPHFPTPSFEVVLPLAKMKPGTYSVTVRDVDFATQTFGVDVTGTFRDGGRVAASREGLQFDFPFGGVSSVAQVRIDAFEPVRADGVLIDDVRLADGLIEIAVDVDIKPGSDPNSVSLGDHGLLPVAILGSPNLDPRRIVSASIRLGGVELASRGSAKALEPAWSLEDVNVDGHLDGVAFFEVQALVNAGALTETTSALTLTGRADGTAIRGSDSVNVVP